MFILAGTKKEQICCQSFMLDCVEAFIGIHQTVFWERNSIPDLGTWWLAAPCSIPKLLLSCALFIHFLGANVQHWKWKIKKEKIIISISPSAPSWGGSPEVQWMYKCLTCTSIMLCMDRFLYHAFFLSICKETNGISNVGGTFVNKCKLKPTCLVTWSINSCRRHLIGF